MQPFLLINLLDRDQHHRADHLAKIVQTKLNVFDILIKV